MLEVRTKLGEVLKAKDVKQMDLAEKSGVRQAYISDMVNNSRTTINRQTLAKVMKALGITDMNEILELVEVEIKRNPRGSDE